MGQQHAIHKFVLGTKDFDDKQSEFISRGAGSNFNPRSHERRDVVKSHGI